MTENSLAEEAQLTLALRKAYLTFHRRANAALLSYGVTADQYVVLSLLRSQKGVTQKWVVDQTGSDPNTVSRLVSTLESKQLLSRQRDPDDGRAYVVKLTSKGSSLVRKTAETAKQMQSRLENLIPKPERNKLLKALQQIEQEFRT